MQAAPAQEVGPDVQEALLQPRDPADHALEAGARLALGQRREAAGARPAAGEGGADGRVQAEHDEGRGQVAKGQGDPALRPGDDPRHQLRHQLHPQPVDLLV